jgi:hypothetical protein
MKRFQTRKIGVALLCLVAMLGFAGCEDDEPPDNISGIWSCTFSRAGEANKAETWNFAQSGQNVTGSYTFGKNTWRFSGTYVDGVFSGVDADQWSLWLDFEEDSASGTIAGDGEVWTAKLSR